MRTAVYFVFAVGLVGCGSPAQTPLAALARSCSAQGASCARPIFNVVNLAKSQEYYVQKLGFHADWEDGDPPDFASVSRADATLFMCEGCQGTPGAWMMVFVPDVDDLHREFSGTGALIRMPPTDMRWGIREMHVADPSGNVIRFGSAIER